MKTFKEVLDTVKEKLSGYGEESLVFQFNNSGYKVSIEYASYCENPFTDWDHPEGSGVDLSNHRDYWPDTFGEAAPVNVPDFLYWVRNDRPEPEEWYLEYHCGRCDYDWWNYNEKDAKQSCPNCEHSQELKPKVQKPHDEGQWESFLEFEKDYYWLPIYMYDHSGCTVNTTGFSCPWDSGTAGIAFVLKETVLKESLYSATSETQDECAEKFLKSHVELLDQVMKGEVYGYRIEKNYDDVASCWSYRGDDGREYCLECLLEALEEDLERDDE